MQLNYEIDDDLHRKAKVAAAEQGITLKQFVIEALRHSIEQHERERPKR